MQDFKYYDSKYRKIRNSLLEGEVLDHFAINNIHKWDVTPAEMMVTIAQRDQQFVNACVYRFDGFEEWQRFRVSLKGWPTQVKLFRLKKRYEALKNTDNAFVENIRINNYISALRRGGILDANNNIKKYGL